MLINSKNRFKPTRLFLTTIVFTLVPALMLMLLLLPAGPAGAAQVSFKDVGPEHPYHPFITNLSGQGLAAGFPDGTFQPDATITRAEFTVLLARAAGISGRENPSTASFNDVTPEHWAYGDIEAAAQSGLIGGYPGDLFKPGNPVSRAEAAALVLRLTKEPLPAVAIPGGVTDVGPNHWARSQIAAALDAGLFEPDSTGKFAPAEPATRAQTAKALALMLSLMPEKAEVKLTGTLKPVAGQVYLKLPGREFTEIDQETICPVGSEVKTGSGGIAELNFPDGSGLRLETDTLLAIHEGQGRAAIFQDGTSGALVDYLHISVTRGHVFGALAAGYFFNDNTDNTADLTNQPAAALNRQNLLAGLTIPSGKLKLAQVEQAPAAQNPELPWWKTTQAKKVRVQVDMPWGVAAIRGTFWSTLVSGNANTLSVADGSAQLSGGGSTITVGVGTASTITGSGRSPSGAQEMPEELLAHWEQVQQWVIQRANAIQNRTPAAAGPNRQIAAGILRSINSALFGSAPLRVIGFDPVDDAVSVPADKKINVIFNTDVQPGESFDEIVLVGPDGQKVPAEIVIEGGTLVIDPTDGLEKGLPVDGAVTVEFDQPLVEKQTTVRLSGGGTTVNLSAEVKGTILYAPYKGLEYGTQYTVTIPQGIVESLASGTLNEEIEWSFITRDRDSE